ncbi:MAG: TIGR02757 family protein [Alphaproteobacteria bacterium]|nr:TIGR02757 family protein [Alphaproteobacteria bacterium]
MSPSLGERLEALYAQTDFVARQTRDPIQLAHRYSAPEDIEIAGLIAAMLAYGRVDLFLPVGAAILDRMDLAGGPRRYIEAFEPAAEAGALEGVRYRWNRGGDFVLLFGALRRIVERWGSLGALLAAQGPPEAPMAARLGGTQDALVQAASEAAKAAGLPSRFEDMPRGFRFFINRPDKGSACKRWNMYLRWMVRPPTEGVDFGVWTGIDPATLVIPLDVHVLRISRFIGLTRRSDGSWRTAEDITASLRQLDPRDPVRFDFAIAHLGISGTCRGGRDPETCPSCALDPVCAAPPLRA